MTKAPEVNWTLINDLATKPHKLVNIVQGAEYYIEVDGVRQPNYHGEALQETRSVQHLCDLAGVPEGHGYSSDVDARVYLMLSELLNLRERLARIAGWHARETGPAGMVGDYCTECGALWPCDTRRLAEGTYTDPEDEP